MKFNVEVDIDYINEDGSLDEEVKHQIILGLSRKLENEFTGEAGKKISLAAEKLITAKTELLIHTLLEKPVTISNGWNSKKEYDSIYDMVEQKMTALYHGKLDNGGNCEKDPLLGRIEKYVENHVNTKIRTIESKIDQYAKRHAKTTLKESSLAKTLREIIPEIDDVIDK